jgi:hypothetical protein
MLGLEGKKALTVLNDNLDQQASLLALNDTSWVIILLSLGMFLLIPLARKRKSQIAHRKTEIQG